MQKINNIHNVIKIIACNIILSRFDIKLIFEESQIDEMIQFFFANNIRSHS